MDLNSLDCVDPRPCFGGVTLCASGCDKLQKKLQGSRCTKQLVDARLGRVRAGRHAERIMPSAYVAVRCQQGKLCSCFKTRDVALGRPGKAGSDRPNVFQVQVSANQK